MKQEYDFSMAKRGQFYNAEAVFNFPVYPDQGVELHSEMKQAIQQSLAYANAEGSMAAAEDVAARLGLDW